MATIDRDKILKENNEIPDSKLPQQDAASKRQLGNAKGQVWIADDFNAPLPDEIVNEFYK